MAIKPCLHRDPITKAGCPNLATSGSYCEVHRAKHKSPSTLVSRTTAHRKKRARLVRQLAAGVPMDCAICGRRLKTGDKVNLHHVRPIVLDGPNEDTALAHRYCDASH